MMHPLLAASVANSLFNDRSAAANSRARRMRRKSHDGARRTAASDDTSGMGMRAAADVVIRRATEADAPALVRLGVLDSNRRAGEALAAATRDEGVLVAESNGKIEAALGFDGEVAVADPFRPSAIHAQLLDLRARQLGGAPASSGARRLVLHPRTS